MHLLDIAVPLPLAGPLTYRVPDSWNQTVEAGCRVTCQVRGRRLIGVVLRSYQGEPSFDPSKLRSITSVVDDQPVVPAELLHFLVNLASYYMAPIGEVVRMALPVLERSHAQKLEQQGLLPDRIRTVGRLVQIAQAVPGAAAQPPVRGVAAKVLALLQEQGPQPVARLQDRFPSARQAIRRLERQGLARVVRQQVDPSSAFATPVARDTPPELTAAQREAVDRVITTLGSGDQPRHFLLDGVTGSGKTEVYLRVIEACLEQGRGALALVPEIALTPQLVSRFRARFGDDVAVLHSGLSPKERYGMWKALRDRRVRVAIGARSAIFAPVPNLGLIVVDEEHDSSFKQEDSVRYHARDMALLRAHLSGAVCVLGSATPSLESQRLADIGKLVRLRLPQRASKHATLPKVEIIDMRHTALHPDGGKLLSIPLVHAVRDTLEAGNQAILFLNRRGFAPSVLCEGCGKLATCPHCSVSLTLHRGRHMSLRCHYCDYRTSMWTKCPHCGSDRIALVGTGTERLEEDLAQAFPSARVVRLDRDVAAGAKSEAIIDKMRRREADILVGTQLVTKGHDLPLVTLVGVLNADSALSLPDFRAGERAFQLLVQVAGRAGRAERPGRVLIQTRLPDHPVLRFAVRQDVAGFVAREWKERLDARYPPAARLVLVRLDAPDQALLAREAARLAAVARKVVETNELQVEILGPSPAPIEKLRARYRFRILLRADERKPLRMVARALQTVFPQLDRHVRAALDFDPQQML